MADLTCTEVDELVPAYALDALDDGDRLDFLAHVAECRMHDAELAASRDVAAHLPDAIEPVEPSPQLRSSVLAAFDASIADNAPATTATRRPGLFQRTGFSYGIAAVIAVVALALGAWGATRGGSGIEEQRVSSGGSSMEVAYLKSHGVAIISLDAPSPPSGRTYQAWQQVDDEMVSIGVLESGKPTAFTVDLGGASAIAISIEPAGGSRSPTSDPVLLTKVDF